MHFALFAARVLFSRSCELTLSYRIDVEHRAVVVSRPVHYGLVRMFGHALAPIGQEVAPFKDIPSAREWLGLPVSDEDIQQEI